MTTCTETFQIEAQGHDEFRGIWSGQVPSNWMKRHRFIEYLEQEFRMHPCTKCGNAFTKTYNKERHESICQCPGVASDTVQAKVEQYAEWRRKVRGFTDYKELQQFVNNTLLTRSPEQAGIM